MDKEEFNGDDLNKPGRRLNHAWKQPSLPEERPRLRLYNSFTRKKDLFVPNSPDQIKWYICGPTVYDSSHMGHARAYLSFDILRRVLQDYFGYNVLYVMNITDIDDKIIKRARQQHLLEKHLYKDRVDLQSLLLLTADALNHFKKKIFTELDADKGKLYNDMVHRVDNCVEELKKALLCAKEQEKIEEIAENLKDSAKDIYADWLDSLHGATISDLQIFDRLSKKYENEFLLDMAQLNVAPPDVLTRVSEFIPEIIAYVVRIIEQGYGYVTKDGSVYFDTIAFEKSGKHYYAKLVPEAFGDSAELLKNMRESEGELSMNNLEVKRNATDFALWKASKEGEPFWDSPWGKGRPGWHIECSAMSCAVCGPHLDIHSGGFDLKFPHHDNEIAQAEAYYDCNDWVNYFLHCGTLRIAGLKMSKSLKNFITIREALKEYSGRQLRILFLMHNWTDVIDYSTSTMERALQFEKITNEFFLLVKDHLRRHYQPDKSDGYQKFEERELNLMEDILKLKSDINLALCDSVDTRTVIEKIREMIALGNAYIIEKEKKDAVPNCMLLKDIATYMTWLLRVFGVIPSDSGIGYSIDSSPISGDSVGSSMEAILMPYVNVLADFREKVRNVAREHRINSILEECDRVRDEILPDLGVRLEDRTNQTCVKLCDRETLLKEQEQKKAILAAKEADKLRKQKEREEREAAKRIAPSELFKVGENIGKYSKFDEKGIPTHLANGDEVAKKQRKKLEKVYEVHVKNYEQLASKNSVKP